MQKNYTKDTLTNIAKRKPMEQSECSVCHACGCGTTLYEVGGKSYCKLHYPVVPITTVIDDQILTPQQILNIANGQ